MKLENQVCSLKQAKKLKDLGVEQLGYFSHQHYPKTIYRSESQQVVNPLFKEGATDAGEWFSAYTVAELGKLLPSTIAHTHNEHSSYYLMMGYSATDTTKHIVYYEDNDLYMPLEILHIVDADTEVYARAEMLIYLIQNNLVQVEACNERLEDWLDL